MGRKVGIELLGLGLAIFSLVAPMLGLALPREVLVLLFSISVLLILAWPVSAFIAWLYADKKKRQVAHIRAWGVIGLIIVLVAIRIAILPEQSNAKPHIAITPALEMMGNQPTVMVMFHNRGREDVDKLTFKILLNDGEKFNENVREVPILRADINRRMFVMIPQDLYDALLAGKEPLKITASVAYSLHGTSYIESCVMKWNALMRAFDYVDC